MEKYRGLSIAALILGIFSFVCLVIFFITIGPSIGSYLKNFIPEQFLVIFVLSCIVIYFPIPAIICGSIDLKRIKSGQYDSKGKGLDIAGIVLGSVFILIVVWFILGEMFTSS